VNEQVQGFKDEINLKIVGKCGRRKDRAPDPNPPLIHIPYIHTCTLTHPLNKQEEALLHDLKIESCMYARFTYDEVEHEHSQVTLTPLSFLNPQPSTLNPDPNDLGDKD